MNSWRHAGAVSESYATTLMFFFMACLSGPHTALGSLAAMRMASCRCWTRVLMYDTWEEALASDGPTSLPLPPKSPAAVIPAVSRIFRYGLLICLGRKASFSPFFSGASGSALALLLAGPLLSLSFLVVPPQPDRATARAQTAAAAAARRRAGERWIMRRPFAVREWISWSRRRRAGDARRSPW